MTESNLVEELLGSKWKVRILSEIIKEREINISALVKRSRSFFKSTIKYIEFLESLGMVKEKRFGKVRIIVANPNSEFLSTIERLLELSSNHSRKFISKQKELSKRT